MTAQLTLDNVGGLVGFSGLFLRATWDKVFLFA